MKYPLHMKERVLIFYRKHIKPKPKWENLTAGDIRWYRVKTNKYILEVWCDVLGNVSAHQKQRENEDVRGSGIFINMDGRSIEEAKDYMLSTILNTKHEYWTGRDNLTGN